MIGIFYFYMKNFLIFNLKQCIGIIGYIANNTLKCTLSRNALKKHDILHRFSSNSNNNFCNIALFYREVVTFKKIYNV